MSYQINQFRRKEVKEKPTFNKVTLHKNLDTFIQKSLDSFTYQELGKEMITSCEFYKKHLLKIKPNIPDLVIFNKVFNKNHCFYDCFSNEFNPFPRKRFIIKKKQYMKTNHTNINNNEQVTEENCENEDFEDTEMNKSNEEIQWGEIDAKELENVKMTFQAIPNEKVFVKNEMRKIDTDELFMNENEFIKDNKEEFDEENFVKNITDIIDNDNIKYDNNVSSLSIDEKKINEQVNSFHKESRDGGNNKSVQKSPNHSEISDSLFSDLTLFSRVEKKSPIHTHYEDENNKIHSDKNLNVVTQEKISSEEPNEPKNAYGLSSNSNIPGLSKQNSINTNTFQKNIIEDPELELIEKYKFKRGWFVKEREKLIHCFTTFELWSYLDKNVRDKKDFTNTWIFEHETDIHFAPLSLYENFKEYKVPEQLKEFQNTLNQKKMMMNNMFFPMQQGKNAQKNNFVPFPNPNMKNQANKGGMPEVCPQFFPYFPIFPMNNIRMPGMPYNNMMMVNNTHQMNNETKDKLQNEEDLKTLK